MLAAWKSYLTHDNHGQDVGGTFEHIPARRSDRQLGCVVAFSSYDAPVPPDSLFGRTSMPGREVLCTNPAALSGGSAMLDSVFPTAPFASGTIIGDATAALGPSPIPESVSTAGVAYLRSYRGSCTTSDGANVLEVQAINGPPTINPVPSAQIGLHLVDSQTARGDIVRMVGQ